MFENFELKKIIMFDGISNARFYGNTCSWDENWSELIGKLKIYEV